MEDNSFFGKETPDKRRRVLRSSSISGDKNTKSSKQTLFNPISEISKENKKPYSAFLIDRPFNKDQPEITVHYLMNCLRYRLRLSFVSDKDGHVDANNSADCMNFEEALESFMLKSSTPSNSNSSAVKRKRSNEVGCFYDMMLQLIDGFDAAGIAEIFRLLLERRNAIPLFSAPLKIHYMDLLQHITMPGNSSIRLGDNKTFLRVAVVSCRHRNESQTCEILKNLFNISSIHAEDFKNDCITSNKLTAELGIGCILVDNSGQQKVNNLLVVHVVGDFRPLWPFLSKFSDYLLIEDATVETTSFNSYFVKGEKDTTTEIPLSKVEFSAIPLVCLWKPSVGDTRCEMKQESECGFRHIRIEGQLGDKTVDALKSTVNVAQRGEVARLESVERLELLKIPLFDADYSALTCHTTSDVESRLARLTSPLGLLKKKDFVLQQNFKEQAKLEEEKYENRLDQGKVQKHETAIRKCLLKRRKDARKVQNHPLLQLLLQLLAGEDSCTRVLSIRMLEKSLAERSERELASQLLDIQNKYTLYIEQSIRKDQQGVNQIDEDVARENLRLARSEFTESVLNIEHIWRELSHVYTALTLKERSVEVNIIPLLAAQHLLDGFCLELLDGDSNLIHLEWMKCVLHELAMLTGNLRRERIFVLSVMGLQSSGKSTLLNTMFGIQMRTSVGQCTRGVNMQLLSVEGRPEYDYILLLDTEGTRSPEYHDQPGSEKRDNQMATLSILLADATIIVTPGENDAAIKEILPIVMMAYQGSKLAEANGGRQSSMMFFVYNRIDTTQKDKLSNIVQTLGTSLNEAFDQVQSLAGNVAENRTDSLFRGFKLDTKNSSESDVCILGNVKKEFSPPGDVPDAAFGEALAQLREHIHQRVTCCSDGRPSWRGRSIKEFSEYLEEVWKCICSANFTLNFASVVERITFDKLDLEYKSVEQKLAESYRTSFGNLKKKMIEEKGKFISSSTSADNSDAVGSDESRLMEFEALLRDEILPTESVLDEEMKTILNNKGREKWSLQFQELWRVNKIEQSRNWSWSLKSSFNMIYNYEHSVENYKKKMRKEISQLFKSTTSIVGEWNESQIKKFNEIYTAFLREALRQFPPMDVVTKISRIYQNSNIIKKRQIDINVYPDEDLFELNVDSESAETSDESETSHQNLYSFFKRKCSVLYSKITNRKSRDLNHSVIDCYQFITRLANKISAGKLCYDDSIISSVICDIDAVITSFHITANSEVQMLHVYGRSLITQLMKTIQEEWEVNNSVYAKLKQSENEEGMRQYFMMSSLGVEKTKLFASTLANVLKNSLATAFEKEMVQRTSNGIRNERWLHDSRFMHKLIDLYLIDLLEEKKVAEVLDYISKPKTLYRTVLHRLIAQKVPDVCQEWNSFSIHLKRAFQAAGLASIEFVNKKAEMFVSELRKELLKSGLLSEYLSTVFLMNYEGEFEDCDKEDKNEFQAACVKELIKVLEDFETTSNNQSYALELSPKVDNYLKLLNDSAALPRCDVCCPLCSSLCVESANHDTKLRPHDAIHQPAGIRGLKALKTDELVYNNCSQNYEQNCQFRIKTGDLWHDYRDFSKVFPDWKDPRINEELPVRQYILATYNREIAKKYHVKPCPNIPAHFYRDLSSVRAQLARETGN